MIATRVASLDASVLPWLPRSWLHAFWVWAELHAEDVVLEVRFLFWTKVVRFRHLFPIFSKVLGRSSAELPTPGLFGSGT